MAPISAGACQVDGEDTPFAGGLGKLDFNPRSPKARDRGTIIVLLIRYRDRGRLLRRSYATRKQRPRRKRHQRRFVWEAVSPQVGG